MSDKAYYCQNCDKPLAVFNTCLSCTIKNKEQIKDLEKLISDIAFSCDNNKLNNVANLFRKELKKIQEKYK